MPVLTTAEKEQQKKDSKYDAEQGGEKEHFHR